MEANDQNIYIPNLCSNGLDLTQGIIFPQRGGEPKFESSLKEMLIVFLFLIRR